MLPRRLVLLALLALLAVPVPLPARAATRVNPFAGARFYVNPDSAAAKQVRAWRVSRPLDSLLLRKIADTPSAEWLGGWYPDVGAHVRQEIARNLRPAGATGFFLLYNMPHRDCGGYSAGGAQVRSYRRWIDQIRRAIGSYPAVVIVEPDALAELGCLGGAAARQRLALIRYAAKRLGGLRRTSVYLDAGSSNWGAPRTIARHLRQAGVRYARGFALNATSYDRTSDNLRYGRQISRAIGGPPRHFIVNTSRNGRGPLPRTLARSAEDLWCNPVGRGLGVRPTTRTGSRLADAYAWFSNPGYSDGPCHGGPPSGDWWPDLALRLSRNAAF